jgi:hypothetical protein
MGAHNSGMAKEASILSQDGYGRIKAAPKTAVAQVPFQGYALSQNGYGFGAFTWTP